MRSLKTKGLLDKDIHGSVVDVFIYSELPKLATNDVIADVSGSLPLTKEHICFDKGHAMYKIHGHSNHQSDFSKHKCTRCGYEEDYQYDYPR